MLASILQKATRTLSKSTLPACQNIRSLAITTRLFATRTFPKPSPVQASLCSRLRWISTTSPAFNEPRFAERDNDFSARDAPSPNKTLFVANVPFVAEEDDIRASFEEFGQIESVRILMKPTGQHMGSARVTFASQDVATEVLEKSQKEPIYIFDRQTRLEYSNSRPPRVPLAPPSQRLYVHSWVGDEDELRDALQDHARHVEEIYFHRDRHTGERTGTTFVNFTSVDRATEAMKDLHGSVAQNGQVLRLFYARPRPVKNQERSWGRRGSR